MDMYALLILIVSSIRTVTMVTNIPYTWPQWPYSQ